MNSLTLSVLGSVAASAVAFAADVPPMSAAECAVWNREMSFAKSVDNHDVKAFASHVHPDAVFEAATANPVRGRDAVVEGWAPLFAGKDVVLVWRPRFVSIGGDPNVAMSRGPVMITDNRPEAKAHWRINTFASVWVRANAHAPWMVLFDGGGPPSTPVATETEALAHMATAPATCPQK